MFCWTGVRLILNNLYKNYSVKETLKISQPERLLNFFAEVAKVILHWTIALVWFYLFLLFKLILCLSSKLWSKFRLVNEEETK